MHVNGHHARAIPVEPPPSTFAFPPLNDADENGKVVVGGDLEPGTLLAAYRSGLFPMRQGTGELAWWSPDPRGVLDVEGLRVSRSLARSVRRFDITVDACFERVVAACAERSADEYEWITAEVRDAYAELHRLGWAHSVEAWSTPDEGEAELVGGLYGVAIGGLFSGESMFNRRPDASKSALVALVGAMRADGHDGAGRMIDIQWVTPHLASLGAVPVSRDEYVARLQHALALALPPALTAPPTS
jgi:leucyl/phenylalanyl-tRNA--protein transferase